MKSMEPFVSGVLRRFASDLGLDRDDAFIAYRALVDRAHAACVQRRTACSGFLPAILVTTQAVSGTAHVSFCDNGEALEAAEVRQLYNAIRTGRVGSVHRALIANGVDGAESIVGRFGVSMLAALTIADQVTIATRSHAASPEAGHKFTCNSRTYATEPYRMPRPGTLVQLRIRQDMQSLGMPDVVKAALEDYARTLALPVRIN